MRKPAAVSIVAAVVVLTALGGSWAAASAASPDKHPAQDELAALRRATDKYHDVNEAIASGRHDLHLCVDHMGRHYADPTTFSDGILDPANPEALVYADDGSGHLRLDAVEWVSTAPGTVMGHPLHLNAQLGVWVLHAWIWSGNPAGLFEDMNPSIGACPSS
jgi:hypothetical protein